MIWSAAALSAVNWHIMMLPSQSAGISSTRHSLLNIRDDTKPAKKSKATADPTPDSAFPPAPLFTPTPYTAPTKAEALSRVDSLASGFILLKLSHASAEGAYEWTLEGTDAKDVYYPLDLLHLYATKYPESAMGEFIDDYCRWFGLPPPPADEDSGEGRKVGGEGGGDGEGGKEGSTEDEKKKEKPTGKKYKKGKKGMNARERRKARRVAGQEGTLSEDVEAEERDELVSDMTVSACSNLAPASRRLLDPLFLSEIQWPSS